MKKKKPMTRNIRARRERTVGEAIQRLWKVIDEAETYLEDEMTNPEEKRRWAKVLCDTIGVLNKLLASKGEKTLEDEDLGSLLFKVPRRFRATVLRGVKRWRRRSFYID